MKRIAVIGLLLATALFGAAIARAELAGENGLFVSFGGGFNPRSLPRDRDVPVPSTSIPRSKPRKGSGRRSFAGSPSR